MQGVLLSLFLIVIYNINNINGMDQDISLSLQKENKEIVGLFSSLSDWRYGMPRKEANKILKQLSRDAYFPYQDIMVNGEVLWRGVGTDCPSRYQAIYNNLVTRYPKGCTVLDIGANNGYFSLRLAQDLGATCVMADGTDRLAEICKLNTTIADKLVYLKKYLTVEDLKKLNKSNHFDVIIGLHVLHHIPEWKEFTEELFKLGDTIILETPPANDPRLEKKSTIPAIEQELMHKNGTVIAETPRTIPGYFGSLTKMKVDMNISVPTDQQVKSKMFLFKNKEAQQPAQLNKEALESFNRVH